MSKIHYFQRYSTPENTVTNNTLQLFSRIYEYSSPKLDKFLSALLELESVGVGIEINQQQRGKNSVPDGIILQRSFKLVVEAKVGSGIDIQQLINHCEAFGDEKLKILMLLTIHPIAKSSHEEIATKIHQRCNSVIFRNITYENICKSLDGLFKEFEGNIALITEDYKTYCHDTGLISIAGDVMRIVPTGTSFSLNRKHAMYFDPASRGYSPHAYIGFYKDKAVRSMIKVRSVFNVDYEGGKLKKTHISGENTSDFDARIIAMIAEARRDCHYEIATGHKFFCADHSFDTCYKKSTRNGIQGARFHNLRSLGLKNVTNAHEVAEFLKTKTWE